VLGSGNEVAHSGVFYRRNLSASDPDGDPLTWSLNSNATWLSMGAANGSLYGPAPAFEASYYVNASVDDGLGGIGYRNFTLTISNNRPTITSTVVNTTAFRTGFSRAFEAFDADGDALTWSLDTNAPLLTIDPLTGTVTSLGTIPPGAFYLRVTVTDGFGGVDVVNYTVTFLNRPPALAGSPPSPPAAGGSYTTTFQASDPDGDPLTWSLNSNATWLSIDSSGRLSGTAAAGSYYVNVAAADPYGGVAYHNFTLVVQAPPTVLPSDWSLPLVGLVALLGIAGAAIALKKRRPKGDIVLKAFVFNERGIMLGELVSDEEEPPLKFKDIVKALPGGKVDADHWLELPPYTVAIVREGKLHVAAVSRIKRRPLVVTEAKKVLEDLMGDEEVKAAIAEGTRGP
jgi:hypothetical protein